MSYYEINEWENIGNFNDFSGITGPSKTVSPQVSNINNNNISMKLYTELRNNINNRDSIFMKNYERRVNEILSPISGRNSKKNCDKLFFIFEKKFNDINMVNTDSYGSGFQDIFNDIQIPRTFSISKAFKKSHIQGVDTPFVFYSMLDFFHILDKPSHCVMDGIHSEIARPLAGHLVAPIIVSSETNKKKPQAMATKSRMINELFKSQIDECITNQEILVGFIDIYNRTTDMGHKNCLIIDTKHKVLVHFEPKSKSMLSSVAELLRFDMNEETIKRELGVFSELKHYNYIKVYGNQTTISPWTFDSVYCVIYSLYAGLLFLKNFNIMVQKLKRSRVVNNFELLEVAEIPNERNIRKSGRKVFGYSLPFGIKSKRRKRPSKKHKRPPRKKTSKRKYTKKRKK